METTEQVASKVKEVPIWDIIQSSNAGIGWLVNLGLLIMFGYVIYVFIERYLAIRRASSAETDFMQKIKEYLREGKIDQAKELCGRYNSPSARILEKGIERLGKPIETITASIESTGKLEVSRLEQKVSYLATASGAGPMLGFLGTVIGMVVVFIDLQNQAALELKVIAPGIMTAMITTVGGLIVGIIAFMGHNYLMSKIGKVVYQMENTALEFIDFLHTPTK
ncbi:MAG: MotA/TolQ/ExbB proton channel family protein [Flavobacteriia bacterium]|nr:MotA/TolQ/ExbB proton channel family protein [Flavobacteriia bacterium]